MRIVAGSGVARDFRQAEIDRHIEMVSRFIERAKDHELSTACRHPDPALGELGAGESARFHEG